MHGERGAYFDQTAGLRSPSLEHAVEFLPVGGHAPFLVLPLGVLRVHGCDVDDFAVFDG